MTISILVITAILLVAYDIFAVIKGGTSNTISWQLYSAARLYPIIPFALGVVFGHMFWPV